MKVAHGSAPPRRLLITAVVVMGTTAATLSCGRVPTTPNDNTWQFLPGHVESFSYAPFRDGRPCWVYLPPGYATSGQRYPVLYMNDGHAAFDVQGGIHANRICEELIRRGEIQPLIVVAISVLSDDDRFIEYIPSWGGDAYVRALRDTLKPEIDRRFRTLPDRAHTAISGWSLSGLISAYAGFAYDSTFGMVGAFSPSYGFYWNIHSLAHRGPLRFYQDTGYPYDNYIGAMEQVLLDQGYTLGVDLMSVTVEGAQHAGGAWAHRFPDMLRFLFPP